MSKTDHGKSKICELLSQFSSFARFVYGVLASDCSNCQRFPRICDDVAWFNGFRSRWHQHIWNLVAFPLKVEYCIQHCGTLNSYVVHCAKLRLVGIYICVMFACVGVPSGTFLQINLSFWHIQWQIKYHLSLSQCISGWRACAGCSGFDAQCLFES